MKCNMTLGKARYMFGLLLVWMVCFLPVVSFSAEEKVKPEKSSAFQQPKASRTADDFFNEAQTLLQKNPGEAVRLLKQGLAMKPGALPERHQLATLYENQKQWNLAIAEYEIVNCTTGTAESFLKLANALASAGYTVEGAIKAEEGAKKYPSQEELQLLAGEQLAAAGQGKKATPYLQHAARSAPKKAHIHTLLGQIYDKEGHTNRPLPLIRTRKMP
jgi:predicted Zn-dependent protease